MDHKKFLSRIGKIGGKARMDKLTEKERHELAVLAAFSISREQRVANAKKANIASQAVRRAKKLIVHN